MKLITLGIMAGLISLFLVAGGGANAAPNNKKAMKAIALPAQSGEVKHDLAIELTGRAATSSSEKKGATVVTTIMDHLTFKVTNGGPNAAQKFHIFFGNMGKIAKSSPVQCPAPLALLSTQNCVYKGAPLKSGESLVFEIVETYQWYEKPEFIINPLELMERAEIQSPNDPNAKNNIAVIRVKK